MDNPLNLMDILDRTRYTGNCTVRPTHDDYTIAQGEQSRGRMPEVIMYICECGQVFTEYWDHIREELVYTERNIPIPKNLPIRQCQRCALRLNEGLTTINDTDYN